jgi:hypothetical protein
MPTVFLVDGGTSLVRSKLARARRCVCGADRCVYRVLSRSVDPVGEFMG